LELFLVFPLTFLLMLGFDLISFWFLGIVDFHILGLPISLLQSFEVRIGRVVLLI